MGEVVRLAAWSSANRTRTRPQARFGSNEEIRSGSPDRPSGQAVAPVRPILDGWHPSVGPADDGPNAPPASIASGLAGRQIARLERAVMRIDGMTATISSRGGSLEPSVETELLALVGEISLGMLDAAADRAERLARGLGGAASSGP